MATSAGDGSDRPQRWARPFVTLLLATFLICGVFGIEAWPLSGFRLFSAPRGPISSGWRLIAVTEDGTEVPVNVSRLGAAYRGFGFVARTFQELSPAERAAACRAWAGAASSIGIDVATLRLVGFERSLIPRDEDGPLVEPTRSVVATCEVNPA
jgi:hypothetical protein